MVDYSPDPLQRYVDEVAEMVKAIPVDDLRRVVEAIREVGRKGWQTFIMGNGGSAATASHMACDLGRIPVVPGAKPLRAIALTDNVPLMTACANDTSYEEIFTSQLRNLLRSGDLLIAISGSGNSPNLLHAVQYAKSEGAATAAFLGHPGGRLREMVDLPVVVPSRRIEQAEDAHLILDHAIAVALRAAISRV